MKTTPSPRKVGNMGMVKSVRRRLGAVERDGNDFDRQKSLDPKTDSRLFGAEPVQCRRTGLRALG